MPDELFRTPDGFEPAPMLQQALSCPHDFELVAAFEQCGHLTLILRPVVHFQDDEVASEETPDD